MSSASCIYEEHMPFGTKRTISSTILFCEGLDAIEYARNSSVSGILNCTYWPGLKLIAEGSSNFKKICFISSVSSNILTTAALYSWADRSSGEIKTSISFFTLTWQASLTPFSLSLREKNTSSVGSILPPQLNISILQYPQVAFPPQADGTKILFCAK